MSREIKFRAWDGEKMRECDFCYLDEDDGLGFDIQEHNVIQYTGLKDKNGVEIYESDIVEISQMAHGSKKTKVVFENFMYKFISLDDDRLWYFSDISKNMKLKVIGNIYETPNLLNN